ncbi:MAG: NYN domain-containing protein [Candidatus Vogelbacteria bacterium]|nr:NYN domain-containing protein [Candidatus Vogelbacteria bacterium]
MTNEKLKLYSKLKQKKYREENKQFLIEGIHLIEECLKSKYYKKNIVEIFLRKDFENEKILNKLKNVEFEYLSDTDYKKLTEIITGNDNCKIQYCVGEIKREKDNTKSEKMYAGQQSLFYNLEKQGIEVVKGFMLKTGEVYQEKGVDVRIALNILKGALKNDYDECYVISSDTDIIPAIKDAKIEGKKIVYVGFENFVSHAMKNNCSKYFILKSQDLRNCVQEISK